MNKRTTTLSPDEELLQIIRLCSQRLRLSLAVQGLWWGLVGGLVLLGVTGLTSRCIPLLTSGELQQNIFWFLIFGALTGALTGVLWPVSMIKRLRLFDRKIALEDRLTTAWELQNKHITAPLSMQKMQIEETLLTLRQADITQVFSARPPRNSIMTFIIIMILLIPLFVLPNNQDPVVASQRAEAEFASRAVEKIVTTQNTLSTQDSLVSQERKAAMAILEQALDVLQNHQSSLDEKLTALTEAEYMLAQMRPFSQIDLSTFSANLPIDSDDNVLADDSVIQHLDDALTRSDMDAVISILERITQTDPEQLSPAELQGLADMLEQLSEAILPHQPNWASTLEYTAKTITEGDSDSVQQALQDAMDTLTQNQQYDAALQQAQAGVQQAQQSLRQSSKKTMGMNTGYQNSVESGAENFGSGESDGISDGLGSDTGNGEEQHNGDSNSAKNIEAERLAAVGGEITIPRSHTQGEPVQGEGFINESKVPYQDVYTEYAGVAEATLSRRIYPPLMRDYIRDYFNSLGY